jgi:N-acetylmuramoyl-L-alanine amidase
MQSSKKINLALKKELILALLLLFFSVLSFERVQAVKKIKILDVKELKDSILIIHDSPVDIKFKKRIYDLPARLVFDIYESELKTPKKEFKFQNSDIKMLRIAQFSPDLVRIVFEAEKLSSLEKIKMEIAGQNLYFKFGQRDVVVEDIKLDKGDLLVTANGILNLREIKLDNPKRLVVDLLGANLKNPSLKKTLPNGEEIIRVSQFDESTVRIVFTGEDSQARDLRISASETQLLIRGKAGTAEKSKELKDKILSLKLIEKNENESIFVIEASKKLDYKFLKLHNPERLVVDLMDIAFEEELLATQFQETKHVKNLRFGLATLGRPVTRIVFDLKGTDYLSEFESSLEGRNLIVKVANSDLSLSKDGGVVAPAQNSIGKKILIDAGHGGYDPGAVYGSRDEKDITLSISRKVYKYLSEAGIQAYMTRTEDRYISLAERVEISNTIEPAVFVSIHANALATNPNMDGLQTYYYSPAGYKLASAIHKQLIRDIGMPDRRVRKAAFWVCKYTKAPSILLELGFMTNDSERKKLLTDSYQTELAKSIARGLIDYLEKS